ADTDHVVSFDRAGTERRWSELLASASALAAALDAADGQRWAVDLDDTFEFAAALLGCWAAHKTPVLAPRPLLESAALAIDGTIGPHDGAAGARRIPWQRLPAARSFIAEVPRDAELVLYTSGSTGVPKEVRRQVHNVEAELAVLEQLWGHTLSRCRVYSTVSHRHVYGMLFRTLWPLLTRRPFATFDLDYPEQLVDERGNGQALIASPALLKRLGHLPARLTPWRAVFSSGGLLLGHVAVDAARALGTCPVEVLGSTETSGIAFRQQIDAANTEWTAMPTVETRRSNDGLLEARSPFTGQPHWLATGDLVRFAADGRFALLGRGDHLAKIEDKRVSLAEIERYLRDSPWVRDAAAVAFTDVARQYVGAVLELSEHGARELDARGRRAFGALLKQSLRGKIEPVALPRKFRFVAEIPTDAQGKRHAAKLRELFEPR
ncbi:MAG TPA: class I adenylate-forming enzyme family protein, partial [Gammaproteobacteria bacterium]|nr:class I adenylate-forming enzyme family protein [Gammaproteobacteria bacterium]